jgi:hypothetical protein
MRLWDGGHDAVLVDGVLLLMVRQIEQAEGGDTSANERHALSRDEAADCPLGSLEWSTARSC